MAAQHVATESPPHAKEPGVHTEDFRLFCFDLGGLHPGVQFMILAIGIYLNYCMASYAQEAVYAVGFDFTLLLTFLTTVLSMSLGTLAGGAAKRVGPWQAYFVLGALSMATMFFSNASLVYLSYPVQAVFKTSKIIPVMIVGVILYRKVFTVWHYVSALLLVCGLILFTLAGASVSPTFSPLGVVLICCALFADAFIGNFQESMFDARSRPSESEVIVFSNCVAAGISSVGCLGRGELFPGIFFLHANPATLVHVILYASANFFGQFFVLAMIRHFGPVLTVFTTATRKAVTVVLSFLLFPKPFTMEYLIGGTFVMAGIMMEVRLAHKKKAPAIEPVPVEPPESAVDVEEAGSPGEREEGPEQRPEQRKSSE